MNQSKNDKGIQIRRKLKSIYYGFKTMWRHYSRFVRNANYDYYASKESFLPIIVANYHVIEKSLAMPCFEFGRGKERVMVVCGDLLKYRELDFDLDNIQYISALQAVDEYNRIHKDAEYKLDNTLQLAIDKVLEGVDIPNHNQPNTTFDEFFTYSDASFENFARSRHSCRSYSDKDIPISEIEACVDLARTTPTPCNRQPNKTYVVTNKEMIERITHIQGGGHGFADKASKLLVITSRINVFSYVEMNEAFKSGGMYTMNLLYTLHHRRIGACPLEWGEHPHKDKLLRQLVGIPDNEEIIMLISVGYPIDEFKYVSSERDDVKDSMVVIR